MGTYYCRDGETHNGDGSTKDAAAGDGLAGAFNDLKAQLTNTTTSMSPGDTLIVKTTQTDDSTDITIAITADTTFLIGTNDADTGSYKVYFDDGAEWSGAGGEVIFEIANNSAVQIIFGDFAQYYGNPTTKNFTFRSLYAGATSYSSFLKIGSVVLSGFKIETTYFSTSGGSIIELPGLSGCILENFTYDQQGMYSTASYNGLFFSTNSSRVVMRNFELNYTGTFIPSTKPYLFKVNGDANVIELINGKITGTFESQYLHIGDASQDGNIFTMLNVVPDFLDNVKPKPKTTEFIDDSSIVCVQYANIPGNKHKFVRAHSAAYSEWDGDANYPVLNAVLPDGTGWSIKCYPHFVSPRFVWPIMQVSKIWNGGINSLDITVEMLLEDSDMDTATTEEIWIVVSYLDNTTGELVSYSTQVRRSTSTLAAGSTSWSTEGYGALNFTPKKIVYSTPSTVKDDTEVSVSLLITKRSSSSDGIIFVCPDVQMAVS